MDKYEIAQAIKNNLLTLDSSISRLKYILSQTTDPLLRRELKEELEDLCALKSCFTALATNIIEDKKSQNDQSFTV